MRKTVIDKVICKVDVVNQYRVVACWTYGCPGVTMSFAKLVAPLFTWWKKKKKKNKLSDGDVFWEEFGIERGWL